MLLIAQNLNSGGSRRVHDVIQRREAAAIAQIAGEQARAGADYLDVNAAAWGEAEEPDALRWLVEAVQEAVDVPLSLDSTNAAALRSVLLLCRRPPLLNGFSGALPDPEAFLSLTRDFPGLLVVALCLDTQGTRTDAGQRIEIAARLVGQLAAQGVGEGSLILDPVTLPSSCGAEALTITLETMRCLRAQFPRSRILGVPGDYSFGLAQRRAAEREYTAKAREAGADAFLCDVARLRMGGHGGPPLRTS